MPKRKAPEPEILPGIFYVKELLKRRKRKGRVEFLVSWHDYENQNTWEPVKNLPSEMVTVFRTRRKKRKASATEEADASSAGESDSLLLLQEISKRAKFSTKQRTTKGTFAEKDVDHLSWKNYVRLFFHGHPGFNMPCCGKSYHIADSFITHWYRHHNRP